MKKITFVLLFLGLALTKSAQANISPPPEKCPGIKAIKSVGLDFAKKDCFLPSYVVGQTRNTYGTTQNWFYYIDGITGDTGSEAEALKYGREVLKKLSGSPTPILDPRGRWQCVYHVGLFPTAAWLLPD